MKVALSRTLRRGSGLISMKRGSVRAAGIALGPIVIRRDGDDGGIADPPRRAESNPCCWGLPKDCTSSNR